MRIALAQIVSTADPSENLGLVADGAQRAAAAGATVVVGAPKHAGATGGPCRVFAISPG